jgi:type II secretory pathway pseudopilin PulG
LSEQSKIPARLRGIDAAKRGDKIAARRLLQQVLSTDVDNEMALMWMASVVDTLNERRFYLERALSINPNNTRAREALRRLGVNEPQVRRAPSSPTSTTATGETRSVPRSNTNLYLVAAALVAIAIIAFIVVSAIQSLQTQQPPAQQVAQATIQAIINPTATATRDTRPPTATVFTGVIVTLDPNVITPLPPTFTATPTTLPTETPLPTVTPFPLGNFTMLYSDIEPGAADPSLYRGNADGSGEIKLEAGDNGGFRDLSYDSNGDRIVFVRDAPVGEAGESFSPELFVSTAAEPQNATQITMLPPATVFANPDWSPDGTHIIFASDLDGDAEIMIVNDKGIDLEQLTNNENARDVEPRFSPDGTKILFTSDLNSPGFNEIYVMDADGKNIHQLTEIPNSYSANWSPDGTRIVYVSDQSGDGDIYVMDADGQRPTLLTQDDNGAEDRSPVWSPDGRWIIFATNRNDDKFRWYAIDLEGNLQPVTLPGRDPQSLDFTN